jgi:hypothetical protein
VRDDGKGIAPKLISDDGREGHFGLRACGRGPSSWAAS